MNTYEINFSAVCPVNEQQIEYHLTIRVDSSRVIKVEAIVALVSEFSRGYHEDFADRLHAAFGGVQILIAVHHGVRITTERS